MKLSDYLTTEQVAILEGTTKRAALEELGALMVALTDHLTSAELMPSIWAREEMMSTGIGHGLAIPHVRLSSLAHPAMVVGVSEAGVDDYESLDGEPVYLILMIAAPLGQHETHIRLLALVTNTLKDADLRQAIISSDDPERIRGLLARGER